MNFTKFDFGILLTMLLIVVFMSFTFPAMGMAGNNTNASEIPTFNITGSTFQIVGDFPESPGQPSKGYLEWDEDSQGVDMRNQQILTGSLGDGTEINMINFGDGTNPDVEVGLDVWDNNGNLAYEDNATLTGEGQSFQLAYNGSVSGEGYTFLIEFNVTRYENVGSDEFYSQVDWEIIEQSEDQGWIERIPGIGGIFSAGEALAGIVAYIAGILFWTFGTLFEVILLLFTVLIKSVFFLVQLMHFLLSNYFGIIGAAKAGWITMLITIPGLILFLEFVKIAMIMISLLPTT